MTPALELAVVLVAAVIAVASYWLLRDGANAQGLIEPALVAGLLVANSAAGIAVMML